MASIGHVLVGLAAARAHDNRVESTSPLRSPRMRVVSALAFAQLSLLPDLDVIGFRFGVAYGDQFGHRGASHSLLAAVLVGLAATPLLARGLRSPLVPTALTAIAVVLSHGLLDMLTDGGLGIAILWPLSDARFFAPVQPLPVAPIGRAFFSSLGFAVALNELILFAPFALFATFGGRWARSSRRKRRAT